MNIFKLCFKFYKLITIKIFLINYMGLSMHGLFVPLRCKQKNVIKYKWNSLWLTWVLWLISGAVLDLLYAPIRSFNILRALLHSNLWCLSNDWSCRFFSLQIFSPSLSWFYDWRFGSSIPDMFSNLDAFFEIEHFAQASNVNHCQRYFGRSYRQHIVLSSSAPF